MLGEWICQCNTIVPIWDEVCPKCKEPRGFKLDRTDAVLAYMDYFKEKCRERRKEDPGTILTKEEFAKFKALFEKEI